MKRQVLNWYNIVQGLTFLGGLKEGLSDDYDEPDGREKVAELHKAQLIRSEIREGFHKGFHKVVIDLDHPAVLVDSTTPGHHHLIIDAPMSWDMYVNLLHALSDAGLVESGYVQASLKRGGTDVRVPWVFKRKPSEEAHKRGWEYFDHAYRQENSGAAAHLVRSH